MKSSEVKAVCVLGKMLSATTRILLLNALADEEEATVSGLASVLELPLAAISHHLTILEKGGLVMSEMRGREKYVRLAPRWDDTIEGILDMIVEEGGEDE